MPRCTCGHDEYYHTLNKATKHNECDYCDCLDYEDGGEEGDDDTGHGDEDDDAWVDEY